LRTCVTNIQIDVVALQDIFFHVDVFDRRGRVQVKSATGKKEKCDYPSKQKNGDEKQGNRSNGKPF
jgi:hypothetical protein